MPVLFVRDSVNHINKVLEVDGSNQLSVKDATAQGSLATIATASATQATAANQSSILTLLNDLDNHGSVSATAIHQTTAHTKLDTIASNQAAQATAMNQSTANGSLAAIESSLAGTLTVSAAAPARSSGQIASAASKTAGDLSSSVDGNSHRKCAIFGSCSDNSGAVKVHISHDDITFYEDNMAHYYANMSNGHIAGSFDINAPYFKVEFMDTATYTLEYSMVD
tara:strand:- start:566 stop:1237 length:672 start_codon:yes stop_codon:yes gene_type:complete